MYPSVAILGVGPSGLAAATAVIAAGGEVQFFAKRIEMSHLYGCQYLHAPIPGYEDVRSATVGYKLLGSAEDYRLKVYGADWDGKVSPEDLAGSHTAWDIRATYRRMWNDLHADVNVTWWNTDINPKFLRQHGNTFREYDAVISTIPATALCEAPGGHLFRSHAVYANGDKEPYDYFPPDNTIICDGTDEHFWYRYARVFGYSTCEWSGVNGGGSRVTKPLSTNCDCFPPVIRAGRYGRWEKGILVHQVYQQIKHLMVLLNGDRDWLATKIPEQVCRHCARWGDSVTAIAGRTTYVCGRGHLWPAEVHG